VDVHAEHRNVVRALAAAAAAAGLAPAAARALDCAAALVLAIDVSSSVDVREHHLQMSGLAAAFRDPAVVETILGEGGIMAAAFAWSGYQHQEMLVDWRWLGDAPAIADFADALSAAPRRYDHWPTALGQAALFAAQLHARNPVSCRRAIIDVSGDGANNDGVGPEFHRDRGAFDGVTVNGLAIRGAEPDPEAYYLTNLIHGPGAFVEAVDSYDDYPEAILRKLLRELQPPFAALD
jgi:hypothetical protein